MGKNIGAGRAFRAIDRQLDAAAFGPFWLKDERIAACVVEALRFGENQLHLYQLHAYVVMPNHVHVLLRPAGPLARITKLLKGYASRRANEMLGRTGLPFWQAESFDHWVRSQRAFVRIVAYIEWNPVSAGLVERPEQWPWSSAWRGREQ